MIKYIYKLILCVLCSLATINSYSVPAIPYPITRVQPDGSELTIYLRGDEYFNYEITTDGYLIRQNKEGFYTYAEKNAAGSIIPTNIKVNPIDKRTSEELNYIQSVSRFPDFREINVQRRAARAPAASAIQTTFPKTGSPKSIVILVNYKDVSFVTPSPRDAFTRMLNEKDYSDNGATGSARDYFKVASNGISSPEFVVVGPYTLPNNRAYYGANESPNEDDIRPREMIIHACNAAAADGVDFSLYDTDNDGIVDNVFVFYAGHNEAEGGPKESIWPHRTELTTTLILNGKRIKVYACTSELRGASGTNMCGIGTFAHEFGHVYGLVDYYPTNNAEHHTLSRWNIMDEGAYLNLGRTPPTYSAYDRFYLGWITPTILKSPRDVSLEDLKSSNKAYIITQSGNHNLNGANPNPVEFFTLENRQKTGWDAFIPTSGMLITRIVYNSFYWNNNAPNNDPNAMGVDIIEADGIASRNTLSGDPFPGTANVTSYSPTLRNGTDISRPITNIKLQNGIITFDYMGGGTPSSINTDQYFLSPFSSVIGEPSATQKFTIGGQHLKSDIQINFSFNTHFELKKADDPGDNWTKSILLTAVNNTVENTDILIRYNPIEASLDETHFEYLNVSSEEADFEQSVITGKSTRPVYVVPPVANEASAIDLNGYLASWNAVFDASGYYLTAYNVAEGTSTIREGFDQGLTAPVNWTIQAESVNNSELYAGDSIPSIVLRNTGDYIKTEVYSFPTTGFSFFIASMNEIIGSVDVEAWNGTNWTLLEKINVNAVLKTTKSYTFTVADNYTQFRLIFKKGIASVAVDDIEITFSQRIEYNARNKWTTDTSAFIEFLLPGRSYFYYVKASDRTLNPNKTIRYENITEASNLVEVKLNDDQVIRFSNKEHIMSVYTDNLGNVILDKGTSSEENQDTYIYTLSGNLIKHIHSTNQLIVITGLTKNQAYILKVGNSSVKIIK